MSAIRAHIRSLLGAALLAWGGVAAQAQSVSDFRLPPGTATATPRPQGPVDPEAVPPAAAASPTPAPAPAATAAPPQRVVVPAPAATRAPAPAPSPPPRPAISPAPAPTADAPVASSSASVSPVPAVLPRAVPPEAIGTSEPEAAPPVPAASDGPPVNATETGETPAGPLAAGAALVLAGIAAAVMWRRRPNRTLADDMADDRIGHGLVESAPPAPAEPQIPVPQPPIAPAPVAETVPDPEPIADGGITLELEPLRFNLSLVNATLNYRLRLTNDGAQAVGPLAIAADMIGAHASLPEDSQLGLDGAGLELRHELAALGPGESADLQGELRLPLSAVTPIRSGTAALMVPLIRIRLDGPGIALTRAIVVGESPATAGGLLRPFRLDTGPKTFPAVSQRAIAEAA